MFDHLCQVLPRCKYRMNLEVDDGGDCAHDNSQVGYGYHKETKCSSHPKKSCHDVAKQVKTLLKALIMMLMMMMMAMMLMMILI